MIHVIIKNSDGDYTVVAVGGVIQHGLCPDEALGTVASAIYRERPQFGAVGTHGGRLALEYAQELTDVAKTLTDAAAQVIAARNARLAALIQES